MNFEVQFVDRQKYVRKSDWLVDDVSLSSGLKTPIFRF
jgi:hypothetical protein